MNTLNPHERCECHECTQARWKMSMQGQLSAALQPYRQLTDAVAKDKLPAPTYYPNEILLSGGIGSDAMGKVNPKI